MVQKVVRSIPRGSVMTYGEVAYKAGRPGAARAVGTIMSENDDTTVPCHRVIRADGKIGEYNGLRGKKTKAELLKAEGYLS
ncbi:MAG: MGMT family protein [Candidatus Paceibacterota bacterium]|jgi:O-6-methylguanine DNA methyltransferase